MDVEKVEPLLFTAWLREFSRAVLFGRFGDAMSDYWDLRPRVMEAVLTERPDWCDDPKRPGEESCAAAARRGARSGSRRSCAAVMVPIWRNGNGDGRMSPCLQTRCSAGSRCCAIGCEVAIPTPGAYDTLNRGPSTIRDDAQPFEQRYGAGLRIITDLASPAEARMIATPGQSGNPLSPHLYRSAMPAGGISTGWCPAAPAPSSTLTLVPAR